MSRLPCALLLVAALGCGNRQKAEPPPDASGPVIVSAGAGQEAEPPRLPRVPPPGEEGGTGRPVPTPPTQRPPAEPSGMKPLPGLQGMLVPPSQPGQSRVALEGCLAQAEATEETGARYPAPAVPRRAATPPVTVEPLGGGALVVHELDHGCCLKAEVRSELKGRTVTVTETLSGQACRCRCRSTVRAAVGLPPGEYTLQVVTVEPGHRQVAHEGPLTVR